MIDNDPRKLSPAVQRVWLEVCAEIYARFGWHLFVTTTHRGERAQNRARQSGASRAGWMESWHNFDPAPALDFAIVSDFTKMETRRWARPSVFDYDPQKMYEVGVRAEVRGLVWGGRFKGFPDLPHLQGPAAGKPDASWLEMSPEAREHRVADEIRARAWMNRQRV